MVVIDKLKLQRNGLFVKCYSEGKYIDSFPVKLLQKIEEELWIRDTSGHLSRKKAKK